MIVARKALAGLAFALSLALAGVVQIAVEVFVLHQVDPKWGDERGNFALGLTLLSWLVVGSLCGFLVVIAFVPMRTWNRRDVTLGAIACGLLGWLIARGGLSSLLADQLVANGRAEIVLTAVLPGVLSALAWLGAILAAHAFRAHRTGGAVQQ